MNKYEQLIEHIINDETEKARAIFHNIVVEKSRDIYESLIDEEDLNEVGGNAVEELADEVSYDEEGISEDEDEFGAEDEVGAEEDEMSTDFDDSGDLDAHEEDHGDLSDRVVDLESALDELKAEFDALMAGEAEEPEHADMFGGDEEMTGDEFSGDEFGGEADLDDNIVREYVEKVGETNQKSEGGEVGTGKRATINAKSTVAGKNDMGGSAKNLNQGRAGAEVSAEKPKAKVPHADKFENVPGANAGNTFSNKEAAKAGEGQTTDGKVAVATKSPLRTR